MDADLAADEGGGDVADAGDVLEIEGAEGEVDAEIGNVSEADPESESALEAELDAELESEEVAAQDQEGQTVAEASDEPPPSELEDLPADDLEAPPAEPIAEEPIAPPPPVAEKARIRDIRYLANSTGGTVVIETNQPVTYQTRMNTATNQFIIEMADVELPQELQRPYNTQGAGSRIGGINAYQTAGSTTARIVVQLAGPTGGAEPVVQQEGTSLVVIPPMAPPVAKAPPPAPEPAEKKTSSGEALSARTLDEFLTGNQKFYGRLISLQVKDADVRDVVNFLAEESGANIVMSDDVDGKISLKLRRVPWDQALVTLMRAKGLGYIRQGNVLRISTLRSLQLETEAATKIIESQKSITPRTVEVIPISYAALDDLQKNIAPFLSRDGKVVADNRTSTIIVADRSEAVDRVRKLVKTLDIPPAQVSIESKIVEAIESFSNFLGVNWGFAGSPVNLSASGGPYGSPIDLTMNVRSEIISADFARTNPFNANLNIGTLDFFGNLQAALTLAERDSLAKVISAPRISAMNREKSTITQEGENVSLKTSRNEQTQTIAKEAVRTPFKLEMSVTPQITADGGVIMDLDVKREFIGPIEDEETKVRSINKRSAKTKVLVKNGQTAVIGGIYTNDELEASNGVPGLKNIPLIGWLFKNRSKERSKTELLIFLTPRIMAQDDMSQQNTTVMN